MSGWRVNALLAAGSLVLFLGLAEGTARVFDLRPEGGGALANPAWLGDRWMLRADYRDQMREAGLLARYYELYQWDRFLFFRLRPHVDLELLDVFVPEPARERTRWRVRTGPRGFRTSGFAERPVAGTTRIAALGDSSTFGWGVERHQTYPERLAAALAEQWRAPPETIEVLNLGVPGFSTFQGRVLLEREALPLAPDLVIWSYLSNDGLATGEADRVTYARRAGWAGAVAALLHRSRAFEALEAWIGVARARWQTAAAPDPHDPAQRNVASYGDAARNVVEAVRIARGAGVPIVLLSQCIRGAPARTMEQVAARTGTPHLDATALLDEAVPTLATSAEYADHRRRVAARYGARALAENPRLLAFLPDGCHPNPLGHRLVAERLAGVVGETLERPD